MASSTHHRQLTGARENAIRAALGPQAHITDHYARVGRCSLAEAVVVLMRLERAGLASRGRCYAGMTWKGLR